MATERWDRLVAEWIGSGWSELVAASLPNLLVAPQQTDSWFVGANFPYILWLWLSPLRSAFWACCRRRWRRPHRTSWLGWDSFLNSCIERFNYHSKILREKIENVTLRPSWKLASPTVASSIRSSDEPLSYVIESNREPISLVDVTFADTGCVASKLSSYITSSTLSIINWSAYFFIFVKSKKKKLVQKCLCL